MHPKQLLLPNAVVVAVVLFVAVVVADVEVFERQTEVYRETERERDTAASQFVNLLHLDSFSGPSQTRARDGALPRPLGCVPSRTQTARTDVGFVLGDLTCALALCALFRMDTMLSIVLSRLVHCNTDWPVTSLYSCFAAAAAVVVVVVVRTSSTTTDHIVKQV